MTGIGFLFLLLVAAAGIAVIVFLPRPLARKLWLCGLLFLLGLAFFLLVHALAKARLPTAAGLMFFLLFGGLIGFLFVWGVKRLFGPTRPGARPMSCPPVGQLKDLLAERLPPRDQAHLAAHLEDCKTCQ